MIKESYLNQYIIYKYLKYQNYTYKYLYILKKYLKTLNILI
ncbi:hypothetical protein CNEO4_720009 [Clostridium neonatale]|nr:hypothetical protein CNEO4_720009 [Clostridium neonatale]CAI3710304.1 hypothetical protein CNEO4_760009 [Clostridium neonatale]